MNKQTGIVLAVIIIIIIVGIVWSKSKTAPVAPSSDMSQTEKMETGEGITGTIADGQNDTQSAPATGQPSAGTPSMPAGTVKTFTVLGSNYAFAPNTITVNKGDTVQIIFKNSGGIHDFKIDEFNVATARIQTGQTATVQFVADKSGIFQYYCSVGSHRAMGMWGTLTVK